MLGTCQFCDADEDDKPLHEVCETCCHAIAAVSRLSPAVRELLLTNPEAVERNCQVMDSFRRRQIGALIDAAMNVLHHDTDDEESKREQLLEKFTVILSHDEPAIAALSKPGRDE